jgi:hypothetical protein
MTDLESSVDVGDPTEAVPEGELPFEALDINSLIQEEDIESVRKG